jgi:integrase
MMMTPVTLRIDKRFKGVGRLNRASGTTVPAVKRKLERMLQALYEDSRLDILRALRDGHVGFLQVHDAYQRRALHELPVGETLPELAPAMRAWIESLLVPRDYSAKHVEGLETSRRYFERHDAAARVAELPRVLEALRATLGAKHPRSFNMCRSSALSFVRATLKRSHPLYIACAAVEPRKLEHRAARALLTPAALRGWFPDPDTDVIDAIAWSLVTTGMGAKEYWGAWEIRPDRIHIEGTKRAGRVRDVPLVRAPAVPRLSRDRFEKRFRARIQGQFTPYDLRRTYAQWLESAGVQRTRRRLYLGHGAQDVTDLYEAHEVTAFLVEDAKKLTALLKKKGTTSPKTSAIGTRRAG